MEVNQDDEDLSYGDRIIGCMISEQTVKHDDWFFFVFFMMQRYEDGKPVFSLEHFKISFTDVADVMEHAKGTKSIQDVLKRLIVNTVLFITQPEVQWIPRPRNRKNVERRVRDGKRPLPASDVIRLTGTLKKYFDTYGHYFDGQGYSYKFDVMAHWRHFMSDKFRRIQGMKPDELAKEGYCLHNGYVCRWIPAFVKGEGMYIKKLYKLEKGLEDGELDLDSIKPLDRPLSEIKHGGGL
jgi:hypothetical protein